MENSRLELENKDKKYALFKNNKKFHIEIKDELNSLEKSNIEEEKVKFKNKEKFKLKKIKETKMKNEIKYKLKTINKNEEQLNFKKKRKSLLKIVNKDKEKSSLEIKVKFQLEENSRLEDKLNHEIQLNNSLNNKSFIITKGNNNIITSENNIINQTSLCKFFSKVREEKRNEEKNLIFPREAVQIKTVKDKNGFFKDKNKSRKYFNLKESIIRKIFRNIYLIIIISLILIVSSNNNIKFIEYKFSIITLKINGKGYKDVLSIHFDSDNYPNMIYINGIKQPTIKYQYNLNETDNFVKLIWNNSINFCHCMFEDCKDITEIDLSNFDTSLVTNMWYMFSNCYSLSSLNLSNFNTSLVKLMDNMFSNCYSLSSLNLSNFNTSLVESMDNMFNDCYSLSSLNLSNFNTSLVTDMEYMFYNCSNLEYIIVIYS